MNILVLHPSPRISGMISQVLSSKGYAVAVANRQGAAKAIISDKAAPVDIAIAYDEEGWALSLYREAQNLHLRTKFIFIVTSVSPDPPKCVRKLQYRPGADDNLVRIVEELK